MNPQQNTTEQQQLDDLVKLIREEGIPRAENDGRNDHQIACDILLCLQYASYKYKNGWQNYNLATVTQLFEEKTKMENLNKDNMRLTTEDSNTQIDTDYFDFLDYSSNDESSEVLETNDDSTVFKNPSKKSRSCIPSYPSIISRQRSTNASNFSTYSSSTQGSEYSNITVTNGLLSHDCTTQELLGTSYTTKRPTSSSIYSTIAKHGGSVYVTSTTQGPMFTALTSVDTMQVPTHPDNAITKETQSGLPNGSSSWNHELDTPTSINDPSVLCNLDPNVITFRPTSQGPSKYGSNIIAAFLESDWPSDDEDETPFSCSVKERGQALYEEKRRQAEANSKSDPGSAILPRVRKALPVNENNNVTESSKNPGRKTTKNIGKGKRTTKTAKKSRKQLATIPRSFTSGLNQISDTVPGLQVISPRTTISGSSLAGFGQQQVEEQEQSQIPPIKGTKKKVREFEDFAENLAPVDFDVDKMFDEFDTVTHAINVTPGTMYNQLLADISPSIRNRFAANSPGQEFDYLWATYGASANKRVRKSLINKERVIDADPKATDCENAEVRPSYQESLDAWEASDACPGEISQTPTIIEVPRTPPHQIRSASGVRTPGSAFSLSEFFNLSPSPM